MTNLRPTLRAVPLSPMNTTWGPLLTDYRTHQLAAGRSPGTIRLHYYRLTDLAALTPTVDAVTERMLLSILANPTWKPETRKSVRSVYTVFFRWAHGAGHIPTDPAQGLPTVRVPSAVARPAPEHVVRRALMQADQRTGLMILLAAHAGLRCSEISRVHSSDRVGEELRVLGKGGKTRAVPLMDPLAGRLHQIDGWAFPNGRGGHLSAGHVTRLLSAALPDGWTGHTLRHRMATAAYAGTRDLLAVGAVLGHSRPETTQRYVRIPDDALRAAVAAAVA